MDDEVKSLLTQLVTKVDTIVETLPTLATKAEVAEVKAEVESVKHVVSANYFRLSGKIEQVASMLAEHMADGHKPAAE